MTSELCILLPIWRIPETWLWQCKGAKVQTPNPLCPCHMGQQCKSFLPPSFSGTKVQHGIVPWSGTKVQRYKHLTHCTLVTWDDNAKAFYLLPSQVQRCKGTTWHCTLVRCKGAKVQTPNPLYPCHMGQQCKSIVPITSFSGTKMQRYNTYPIVPLSGTTMQR
jgi:hypothetical protein